MGIEISTNTLENYLLILKIYIPYDPAILLPGRYPTRIYTHEHQEMCTRAFGEAVMIASSWKESY